jgi:hypothetical protein
MVTKENLRRGRKNYIPGIGESGSVNGNDTFVLYEQKKVLKIHGPPIRIGKSSQYTLETLVTQLLGSNTEHAGEPARN